MPKEREARKYLPNTYYVSEALCQAHATLLSFKSHNSPMLKSLVWKVAMALPAHMKGQESRTQWRKSSMVYYMNGRHFECCRTLALRVSL